MKKCENEGQNEKQKKAVKLAPKDYVNKTLIWFFGGFGVQTGHFLDLAQLLRM